MLSIHGSHREKMYFMGFNLDTESTVASLLDDVEDETSTFFVIWGENFRFEVLWMSSWNHIQSKIYFPDNTYDKSSCYAYLRPEDICKCKLQDCSFQISLQNQWVSFASHTNTYFCSIPVCEHFMQKSLSWIS